MKFSAKIIIALFLTALLAGLGAQPAELRQIPLQQDSALLSGELANGLRYYISRNSKPANLAEMRLYVDVGSVNEDEDQRGLAHFTEHMAFNGTVNFEKAEVVNYLSSIGMGYYNGLNAMTSYDFTVFTLKIPTDDSAKLNQGMLILSDMAHQLSFDADEIERERGVITEEWRLGQDAGSRVRDAQNAVFLEGSRYAERSPIGLYEVINGFEHDTIKRFYHDWYRPDLQTVIIVGDFEPQDMLTLVEQYFGAIPKRENPRPREAFDVPENLSPKAIVTTDPEYPNNILQVMWKKDVQRVANFGEFYDELKNNLFYTMLNNRLEEHSKSPHPPYSFAAAFEYPLLRTMSAAAMFAMYTQGGSEEALQTMLTEAERVQRYGFLPSEFDRAKIDVLRSAEQAVAQKDTNESGDLAWELVSAVSNHNVVTSPEFRELLTQQLIDLITLEEVNAEVQTLISDKNMFISVSGPEKEGLSYPSEERLLEIARAVNSSEIASYEDKVVNEPIMENLPEPVAIVREELDSQSNVNIWTLANGIKVYAKRTDFKNDEVLLKAVSRGGYTRYPVSDLPAAALLPGFVGEAGFGSFSSTSLRKATAGKVAQASLGLGNYSESVSASCSPKDMELMFQMLYQYSTNPRFDAQDYASYIQRTKTYYQNRNLEPMNVFLARMSRELYDNHPYYMDLSEVDLDAVSLGSIEAIFRDRFADFSDFSFIVIGAFDEAQLKQYCQTYLGNLPTLKRDDTPVDPGLDTFSGIREVRFRKGSSDRAFAAHFTSGDYQYSLQNQVDMDALEYVMNEKLRENIREELSGVYVIQAWANITEYPKSSYVLGSFMGCSPARVDELNAAIFTTLDSLKAGNLEEKYVTATRETFKQQYQEDSRSNRYWLNQIYSSVWMERPLTEFLELPACYDRLSRERIIAAARQYLNFETNKLSVIMLPEKGDE